MTISNVTGIPKPEEFNTIGEGRRLSRKMPRDFKSYKAMDTSKGKLSLVDHVKLVHEAVYKDPDLSDAYLDLLDAQYSVDAVEGSLSADDYMAAVILREYATDNNYGVVSGSKLNDIKKALGHVLRRNKCSRKQRREAE